MENLIEKSAFDNKKADSPGGAGGSSRLLRLRAHASSTLDRLRTDRSLTHEQLSEIWKDRPKPFWRILPALYETASDRFLQSGDLFSAMDCASEGIQSCGPRPLLVYHKALALARLGSREKAEALLAGSHHGLESLSDYRPLLARLHKDAWKATGNLEALRKSRDLYAEAAADGRDDIYYPAVNAATISLLLGDHERASYFGTLVRDDISRRPTPLNYWELASLAEAELASGDIPSARAAYTAAIACPASPAHLATTREQAVLLLKALGHPPGELNDILGKTDILCFTGHIIDLPRFSHSHEQAVSTEIRNYIATMKPTLGVTSAAAGADLLAHEILAKSGVPFLVILPLHEQSFSNTNVSPYGEAWEKRFSKSIHIRDRVWESSTSDNEGPGDGRAFGNDLILGVARQQAISRGGRISVLAVWNGLKGDGKGYLHDFVMRAKTLDASISVIDPLSPSPATPFESLSSITLAPPEWPWVVHIHGETRPILDALLRHLGDSAHLHSTSSVRLGNQTRLTFETITSCHSFLSAVARAGHDHSCGIGVAVGPFPHQHKGGEPGYFHDAAALAHLARTTTSSFCTWECAAIDALHQKSHLSPEFAGRALLPGDRFSPFYTMKLR